VSEPRVASLLAELPLRRPVSTLVLLLCLAVLGGVALLRLPVGFIPLVNEPEVDVEVPWPGSHPLEGLRQVARPLEEELSTIPDVKRVQSSCEQGSVRLEVGFDWSNDVALKRLEVRDAVERVRPLLPPDVGRVKVEGDVSGPADGSILQGRISAETDLAESWELLDKRIRRPLERVRGVARVDLYGVEPQQVRVELDLAAVRAHGVSPEELIAGLDAANVDLDLGSVRDVLRHGARLRGRFTSVGEVAALPVGPPRPDGSQLRLSDLARVELREPELDYGRHLDRRFAIGIDVFKEPGANTIATVDRLHARIAEIQRDPALRGIRLLVWNDAGKEIRGSMDQLRGSGVWGSLLAVAVLWLFLRRAATTLIVALAIPFSLLVAFGGLFALGGELNVITMLGLMLGVGMLVDNAVVVAENIVRLQREGLPPAQAARQGVREVWVAVLASTATTAIVWSWLLVTERSPLTVYLGGVALTIALSVGASLLVSVTLIPLATARVRARQAAPDLLERRLVPAYRRALALSLRWPRLSLLALLGLAGSSAWPLARLEKSGEPRMRERAVAINYRFYDPGTRETAEQVVDQVEAWLDERRAALGFESIYSYYNEQGWALTWAYLPAEEATDAALERVRAALREGLPQVPGVTLEIGDRQWQRRRGGDGQRKVSVALHGEDPEFLEDLAWQVEERLVGLPGLVEVMGPAVRGRREVLVVVDPVRTRAVGLTPEQVGQAVAFLLRGRSLRRFQSPAGELELQVGLPERLRVGLDVLDDLAIPLPAGGTVPLGAVATVRFGRTPGEVEREDRRTSTWVNLLFAADVNTEAAQGLVRARLDGLRLPEGYAWDFGSWGRSWWWSCSWRRCSSRCSSRSRSWSRSRWPSRAASGPSGRAGSTWTRWRSSA
jgi:HAE1 family hydrophobic/amphiphilic exporter-1